MIARLSVPSSLLFSTLFKFSLSSLFIAPTLYLTLACFVAQCFRYFAITRRSSEFATDVEASCHPTSRRIPSKNELSLYLFNNIFDDLSLNTRCKPNLSDFYWQTAFSIHVSQGMSLDFVLPWHLSNGRVLCSRLAFQVLFSFISSTPSFFVTILILCVSSLWVTTRPGLGLFFAFGLEYTWRAYFFWLRLLVYTLPPIASC